MEGKTCKITTEFKRDVRWWLEFLPTFSGTGILWMLHITEPDREIASDACLVGMGAVCGKEYIKSRFPEEFKPPKYQIAHLEMWAIVVMFKMWGEKLKGKSILVRCDNESVVAVLNAG